MRIGIMGGTFDPIHNGHICLAQKAKQQLKLDEIWMLPSGDPPHKTVLTSKEHRWNLVCMAVENTSIVPCDMELFRSGTTYTVDTMRSLHELHPNVQWFYIIGTDTLYKLKYWREFEKVAKLTEFVVFDRPGMESDETKFAVQFLNDKYGAVFHLLEVSGPDISSTMLRTLAAEGKPLFPYMPTDCANYIADNGLYLTSQPLKKIEQEVQGRLSAHRWQHTLGVMETSKRLAAIHGVNQHHAVLAALLHDVAKPLPLDTLQSVTCKMTDIDQAEASCAEVMHAPASAVIAYEEYGVRHPNILSAIRKHTLGHRDMNALEAILYVADFTEPNRRPFPGLEDAMALAETNIFEAAKLCARLTIQYVAQSGNTPHGRTLDMLSE